jgi:iron complex outermembrane receptor protein
MMLRRLETDVSPVWAQYQAERLGVMRNIASLAAISAFISLGMPMAAAAQDAPDEAAAAAGDEGEIVVTARKREESILKTPVTVTALTADQIEKRSIVSIADVAANTPGFNVNNNSSGRADRTIQGVIIRGFTPSTVVATTTSTFIDGVPVSSPSALNSVGAAERIEVLRGPQSAYFGRNTFAGAINVVNKVPSGEWGGSVTAMLGTRENYRTRAELEGPIAGEALTFRATFDRFGKEGSWVATDGGTLGDQKSTAGSLLVAARPAPWLRAKVFASYSKDEDGISASTRVSAVDVRDGAPGFARFGADSFVVVEKWASVEALQAHAVAPHMKAYAAKVREWTANRAIHVLEPA